MEATASLLNQVEHRLFADLAAGIPMNTLKSAYLKDFQITARHFNALRIGLDGKIKAIEALRAENLKTIEGKIKKLGQAISSLEQQPKRYKNPAFQLHPTTAST
jgi:hypothetical protein